MPRLTTERLALFGTLLATFGELHPLCDHWINAAYAVSTFHGVSVGGWHHLPSRVCCRSVVSRLSSVNASARSASLGVTVA
ncbi:hypothetical protein [Streptomyces sp. NPDC006739]|uniref:hypothetical protein n=1 Tax=Streptomyces sp. NPDC006739 TaxID=3364763 RepID=UPI0036BD6604